MSVETYLAYVATVLVFFAHPPGPGQLLFMAHSMRGGVVRALPVIAGNHLANVLQMLAAGFGLVGAIAASGELFLLIKWFGVGYLVWLGLRMAFGSARVQMHGRRPGGLFRQGFVTAAANPFAIVFFAALFPQFIDPGQALTPQIGLLGVTYLTFDLIVLLAMGVATERLMAHLGRHAERLAGRVAGAFMIGAAVLLGLKDLDRSAEAP